MEESILVDISGGSKEERQYISVVIERSLGENGFTEITNTASIGEKNDVAVTTLFDYAMNQNPDLFARPIEISSTDDSIEEEESDIEEVDIEDDLIDLD